VLGAPRYGTLNDQGRNNTTNNASGAAFTFAFGLQVSKSDMLRSFQQRKWQTKGRFIVYLEEKVILSQTVNVDNDELMKQIIEGISA